MTLRRSWTIGLVVQAERTGRLRRMALATLATCLKSWPDILMCVVHSMQAFFVSPSLIQLLAHRSTRQNPLSEWFLGVLGSEYHRTEEDSNWDFRSIFMTVVIGNRERNYEMQTFRSRTIPCRINRAAQPLTRKHILSCFCSCQWQTTRTSISSID